jgi:hypothetical protein
MLHRGGPDHRDAPSSWLRPGRCRGCPGARGTGAAAGVREWPLGCAGLAGPPRTALATADSAGHRGPGWPPPGLVPAARLIRSGAYVPWCGSFGVRGPGRVTQAASRWLRGDLSCRTGPAGPLPSPGAAPPFRARWHPGYPRTWAVAHRPRPAAPPRARGWRPRGRGWRPRGRGWHQAHRRHRRHHLPRGRELTPKEPHPCGREVLCGSDSQRAGHGISGNGRVRGG